MDMLSSIKHPMCSIQEEQQCAWPCKTIQPMLTEGIDGKFKIKLLNIFQTLEINGAGYTSGKIILISKFSGITFSLQLS